MAAAHGAALVTGGATRLGRAFALALAERGFDVAVHYHRSVEAAQEVVLAIEGQGGRSVPLAADLAEPDACRRLVESSVAALGPLRVLVNNAAVFEMDRPPDVTDGSWARHMAINLHAPFLLTQRMHQHLGEAEGMVVNLVDSRVLNPTPNYTSYTVSKFALAGLTRHLALALAPRLRVNAIAPGIVRADEPLRGSEERLSKDLPLARATGVDELVAALNYLLEAPSITGEMLVLDSGMQLGWLHPGQRRD